MPCPTDTRARRGNDMNKTKRRWIALTAVASLVVLVAGWFLLVQPKRSQVKSLKADAASADSHNQQLQTQLAMLKAQAKNITAQNAALAAAQKKIPTTTDLPGLLRQLQAAADVADVEITQLAPTAPTALVAAPGVSVVSLT